MNTSVITDEFFLQATGIPIISYDKQCHTASLALVRSKKLPKEARVARGTCKEVPGRQHSWVVVGDPYDKKSLIIDPTLWSYSSKVKGIWAGNSSTFGHIPYGAGSFMMGEVPYNVTN